MKIIGHRGAKGLAPENTLASMQAALDNNVDAIEFDVRVTRDNVPVINHNPDIKPPGDVHGTPLIVANSLYFKPSYVAYEHTRPNSIG